jgi:hypothetical protein
MGIENTKALVTSVYAMIIREIVITNGCIK